MPGAMSATDDPVCTVTTQSPITWAPTNPDTPLSATPTSSDRRQKVQFTTADGQPRSMEILYGSTTRTSNLTLTKKNAPDGTANIQYPEGPGLRVNNGWAFITFHWPLIWMESIEAGSIGTTSLLHNQASQADVYLIANKLDTTNPVSPIRPTACSDPNAHLFVKAASSDPACVSIPSGFQAVRRSYKLERDTQGKITKVTFSEQKSLKVSKGGSGHIEVPDDKFLQKVLDCASLQGLYAIP